MLPAPTSSKAYKPMVPSCHDNNTEASIVPVTAIHPLRPKWSRNGTHPRIADVANSRFNHMPTETAGTIRNPNNSSTGPATPPNVIASNRRSKFRSPIRCTLLSLLCRIEEGRTPSAAPMYNNPANWNGGKLRRRSIPIGIDSRDRMAQSNAKRTYSIS